MQHCSASCQSRLTAHQFTRWCSYAAVWCDVRVITKRPFLLLLQMNLGLGLGLDFERNGREQAARKAHEILEGYEYKYDVRAGAWRSAIGRRRHTTHYYTHTQVTRQTGLLLAVWHRTGTLGDLKVHWQGQISGSGDDKGQGKTVDDGSGALCLQAPYTTQVLATYD